VFTTVATLALIALGGLVTSHGVGMAVPDWPNTYGYNMFFFPFSMWVGGVFYEHSHRLFASGVGLLTTVLALWLHGRNARPLMRWVGVSLLVMAGGVLLLKPERWHDAVVLGAVGAAFFGCAFVWPRGEPAPRWLRRMGLAAFAAVVLQGVLGGLRVTAIKDELGIFHAALAQLFFCLLCAIAVFTSKAWQRWTAAAEPGAGKPAGISAWGFTATTCLILAQLVLGATMRHAHAGLAIPDFPLAHGQWWPDTSAEAIALYNEQRIEVTAVNPITAPQIILQMLHRVVAVSILAAVIACAVTAMRRLGRRHRLSRLSLAWTGLIVMQIALGAWTIWSNKAADVATLHVIFGALSLATGTIACIVSFQMACPLPGRAESSAVPLISIAELSPRGMPSPNRS
jgi:cytochrome c oxidase assembly protein subunit 15